MVSKAELEAARKAELEAKEKERETPEWAAGLKQQREAAERRAAMAAEASKPFARSKCETRHQNELIGALQAPGCSAILALGVSGRGKTRARFEDPCGTVARSAGALPRPNEASASALYRGPGGTVHSYLGSQSSGARLWL